MKFVFEKNYKKQLDEIENYAYLNNIWPIGGRITKKESKTARGKQKKIQYDRYLKKKENIEEEKKKIIQSLSEKGYGKIKEINFADAYANKHSVDENYFTVLKIETEKVFIKINIMFEQQTSHELPFFLPDEYQEMKECLIIGADILSVSNEEIFRYEKGDIKYSNFFKFQTDKGFCTSRVLYQGPKEFYDYGINTLNLEVFIKDKTI